MSNSFFVVIIFFWYFLIFLQCCENGLRDKRSFYDYFCFLQTVDVPKCLRHYIRKDWCDMISEVCIVTQSGRVVTFPRSLAVVQYLHWLSSALTPVWLASPILVMLGIEYAPKLLYMNLLIGQRICVFGITPCKLLGHSIYFNLNQVRLKCESCYYETVAGYIIWNRVFFFNFTILIGEIYLNLNLNLI
jgi:hypothetical protein